MRGRKTQRVCVGCGEHFTALMIKVREGKAKYCSTACYHRTRRRNAKALTEKQRGWNLKFHYGITPEEAELIRNSQNNRCAVCRRRFTETPFIDHCHASGRVRGLLCIKCNTGLGMLEDDISRLESAIRYLKSNSMHSGSSVG